jgi:hypothetical protein
MGPLYEPSLPSVTGSKTVIMHTEHFYNKNVDIIFALARSPKAKMVKDHTKEQQQTTFWYCLWEFY